MDLIFGFLYIAIDFSLTSWMYPPPVFTEKTYLSAKIELQNSQQLALPAAAFNREGFLQ
jgi:hypothetical protein